MMRDVRLCWDASSHGNLRAALAMARKIGVAGVTYGVDPLGSAELSQSGRREVRALFARDGMTAVALRADAPGRGLTAEADADALLARLGTAMALARDCGFTLVACDLGRLPRSAAAPPPRRPVDPSGAGLILIPELSPTPAEPTQPLTDAERQHAAFARDVLREAGTLADRSGVAIAFSASLAGHDDLLSLLRAVDAPLLARELDPPASLPASAADLVAQMPAVLHVRGRDAQRGTSGHTRAAAIGAGDVDWQALVEALQDADYHGFISLEGAARSAQATCDFLRR